MKTQKIIHLVLFTFKILILHTTNAKSQQKDQSLIHTTCKHTPNYKLCINTIRADPKCAGADVAGLGLILVEAVKAKSKVALSAVSKLRKSHPNLARPLKKCTDVYETVIQADVPEAEQSIRGNPKFAENGMADAAVEADACERAVINAGGNSNLTAVNCAVRDLAVVARAIIRNLL